MSETIRTKPAPRAASVLVAALLLAAAPPLRAQAPSGAADTGAAQADTGAARAAALTMGAVWVDGHPPRIDGRLDDAVWAQAPLVGNFVQALPRSGEPATERTEVRVAYDREALYVAARLYDAHPEQIGRQLFRRDGSGYSDWFSVQIDSHREGRTGYAFMVTPRGVLKDVLMYDDDREDPTWDAVWAADARVDSAGWTAEFRIPFSQLRFSPGSGERVWGINFQRDVVRKLEKSFWSPTPPDAGVAVSRFGALTGLRDLGSPRRFELQPYMSGRLAREPGDGADPFYHSNDVGGSAGADLRYRVNSDLTLTATLNPDFGQVEVDPAIVNLSAFEIKLPEKRPFFLEGIETFQFGRARSNVAASTPTMFYSRRIGQAPTRSLSGARFPYVDAPDQTTIAGAVKLRGQLGHGWSGGFLNAVTPPERAHYQSDTGDRRSAQVEPLSNYFVGRLRRSLNAGQGFAGVYGTAVNRDLGDSTLATLLRSSAYAGGVDFEHSWARRSWILSGFASGSAVAGNRAAITALQRRSSRYYQRPDADYLHYDTLATSLRGYAAQVALAKTGGGHLRGSLTYQETSPGYEVNDLGFQTRADQRAVGAYAGYVENQPKGWFRSWRGGVYGLGSWNMGGDNLQRFTSLTASGSLRNFWSVSATLDMDFAAYNDRLTRGGPLARTSNRQTLALAFGSDGRKKVSAGPTLAFGRVADGGWSRTLGAVIDFRPSQVVKLSLEPQVTRLNTRTQYVTAAADTLARATFGRRYIFATLDQTTVSMATRLDWTFSPRLSLQLYAQPLVSAADYSQLKEFAAPGTDDFLVYGRDIGTLAVEEDGRTAFDPDGPDGPARTFRLPELDFNLRSLRGNAVLRWEWRQGSTLFLIWQQNRADEELLGDFRLGRDYGALFRQPAHNVFLIKWTYWIG